MKLNKSKKVLIGGGKFQLIGPNEKLSKPMNLKKSKLKPLEKSSQETIDNWFRRSAWTNQGTKESMFQRSSKIKRIHITFIQLLKNNPAKEKKVLVVGLAKGNEASFIKNQFKTAEIDSFDIVNMIEDQHKRNIKNRITSKLGIENYRDKKMIGKYDGITAVFSAGYWTDYPERNILKMSLMLRPQGVALISVKSNFKKAHYEKLNKIFDKFQLTEMFDIKLNTNINALIIKRK